MPSSPPERPREPLGSLGGVGALSVSPLPPSPPQQAPQPPIPVAVREAPGAWGLRWGGGQGEGRGVAWSASPGNFRLSLGGHVRLTSHGYPAYGIHDNAEHVLCRDMVLPPNQVREAQATLCLRPPAWTLTLLIHL